MRSEEDLCKWADCLKTIGQKRRPAQTEARSSVCVYGYSRPSRSRVTARVFYVNGMVLKGLRGAMTFSHHLSHHRLPVDLWGQPGPSIAKATSSAGRRRHTGGMDGALGADVVFCTGCSRELLDEPVLLLANAAGGSVHRKCCVVGRVAWTSLAPLELTKDVGSRWVWCRAGTYESLGWESDRWASKTE